MEFRQLGRSGLKVPALSFGTGTFGGGTEFFRAWGASDVTEATRLVCDRLIDGLLHKHSPTISKRDDPAQSRRVTAAYPSGSDHGTPEESLHALATAPRHRGLSHFLLIRSRLEFHPSNTPDMGHRS